jgi:hypothetical protein
MPDDRSDRREEDGGVRADRGAQRMVWIMLLLGAVVGGIAIWWTQSALEDLTALAQTNRTAAIELFRTRVLPAFVITVLVGVVAGIMMMRQGLQILRAGEFPPPGMRTVAGTPRQRGRTARVVGWLMSITGFLLAAIPLLILIIFLWLLRQA